MNRHRQLCCGCALLLTLAAVAACSANPDKAKREAFTRGSAYLESKKYPEAILEFRRAIQVDSSYGEARKLLAKAYLDSGDYPNALRESVRAADLLPEDDEVQLRAGNLLLAAGKYEDARTRAEQVLTRSPDSSEAHVLRGNALASLKSLDEALTEYEEAAASAPENGLIHSNIGAVQMARGARADAEAAFRKATELSPKSALARVSYANFLLSTNQPEAAEAELKSALDTAPEDATVRRALAMLYVFTNRPADAEPHLQKLADLSADPKDRFALVRFYLALNRRSEALRELSVLASKKDSYAEATLQIAELRYAEGQTADGRRLLAEVLKQSPSNARAHLLDAEFLVTEQKWKEAITAAQAAIGQDPRLSIAYYVLGLAHKGNRDLEEAKKAFSEVLRLEPNATRAQLALAELHLLTQDGETAQQLATQAVAAAPQSAEARTTLVRTMLANKNLGAAEAAINTFKTDYPNRVEPYVLEGALGLIRKDYNAADRAFAKASAIAPGSLEATTGHIQVLIATGRTADARQAAERLTTYNAQNPDALVLGARTYTALRDFASAERLLRKALEVDPSRTQTYTMLAQLYVLQDKIDDALREYQNIATRDPRSVSAHTIIGTLLEVKKQRPEAKAEYRAALAINSSAAVAANNLAWLMAEDGEDLDVALQLAQTAKAQMPNVPEAADTLGWVYMKKGLPGSAVNEFREAVAKQPANAAFKYRLGLAYAKNGDFKEARKTLESALAIDAKAPQAEEARAELARLTRMGS